MITIEEACRKLEKKYEMYVDSGDITIEVTPKRKFICIYVYYRRVYDMFRDIDEYKGHPVQVITLWDLV